MPNKGLKNVLLTGSASGIGWETLQLLASNYQVFAGVKNEDQLAKVNKLGLKNVLPILLDVKDSLQIESSMETIRKAGNGLYAVIHCAGVAHNGPLQWISKENLQDQFATNAIGAVEVIQNAIPLLKMNQGSRIILLGSQAGFFTKPLTIPYSMSKFALEGLVDGLRIELKDMGIFVTLLQPSNSPTPIWDKSLAEGKELLNEKSAEDRKPYSFILERMESFNQKGMQSGIPVREIAQGIIEILKKSRPPIRKRIGFEAKWMWVLAKFLPFRWRDKIIMQRMKRGSR